MGSLRRTSLAAGVLYLITFISIPTLFLYSDVKGPNYLIGSGPVTPVLVGGLLEVIVALAGLGTAVALYPVLKRQHQRSRSASSAPGPWKAPARSPVWSP